MSDPYVGEIRMFAGTFAPVDWALCQGQILPISEYETLYNLLGTTYGGDGESTFGLPDLSGRLPLHFGTGAGLSPRQIGESGGVESVTLTSQNLPPHSHAMPATTERASADYGLSPAGVLASTGATPVYAFASGSNGVDLGSGAIDGGSGQSLPHNNIAPYLCVNFIISLAGIFPSQN